MTATDPTPRPVHRLRMAGVRLHRGWERSLGERAADGVRDALGSWPFLAVAVALVGVGIDAAVAHDDRAGPAAALGLVLGGLAVVELSLVLMAVRRADRTAGRRALRELESMRRAAAGIHEVRDDVAALREDVARLVARLDTRRETAR
jgi:uncharacterized membrane protein